MYTLQTLSRLYTIYRERTYMTIINVMALAVTSVLYVSVYGTTWRDRYLARLTAGAGLALILAVCI